MEADYTYTTPQNRYNRNKCVSFKMPDKKSAAFTL